MKKVSGVLSFEIESHALLRCIRNKVQLRFSWLGDRLVGWLISWVVYLKVGDLCLKLLYIVYDEIYISSFEIFVHILNNFLFLKDGGSVRIRSRLALLMQEKA